ncbi:DUF6332 family protein [Streptomyces flavofungini]|uniref:DUF6332 family protein n=1 Tax=Streptomyces flavofungini TaxID=68200 RepID=UPI00198AB19A|nr:DUF6332 family protein [Streptomyces flavofungini]GHC52089.1 hypothetical protein GCM10010349_17480 [Streptomyces flavofungini]
MDEAVGGGRRSQAERDAITVEIGYALASATAVALAIIGVVVAGPAIAFSLSETTERTLLGVGGSLAATAFVARLVTVLWRFTTRERARRAGLGDGGVPGDGDTGGRGGSA